MIPSKVAIYMAAETTDLRRSFDGLAGLVKERLRLDPASGALFLFFNRTHDRMKLLWLDVAGACILYKRLHRGKFTVPRVRPDASHVKLDARELAQLLAGVPLPRPPHREPGAG